MNRTHLFRVLQLFLLMFTVSGCTREDMCDCQTEVQLRLSYTYNSEDEDLFKELVTCGDILLYRSDGTLMERRAMTMQEYENATLQLTVPWGEASYYVVFWANLLTEHYTLSGEESMQTLQMSIRQEDGQVEGLQNYLLHGTCTFTTDAQRTPVDATISLRNLANEINVVLEGAMSGTRAAGTPYAVQLTGSNGTYNWSGSYLSGDQLNYVPIYTPNLPGYDEALCTTFRTLHLIPEGDMQLRIFGNTEILYEASLVDLLMQHSDIRTEADLWRYSYYYLFFDSNLMLKTIEVL